ncbi:alpha-L-glutamate ligase [Streptomyces sp. HPF1205]|uniref:ATP-grasp domain-containing protein n=1 Tax=Streptomyces sp. HPF1205 TaxID=2873262 RepID=UPI0027E12B59|nr:alpha-L-glutamate ligase [Streptomyces sp. HPF1205]
MRPPHPLRVGLITPDPRHPLLAAAAALLTASGGAVVEVLAPDAGEPPGEPADVYLLKSRVPEAIRLARGLEAAGARVLNSAAATARCQDRTAMAADARRAGLPFAATRTYPSAAELARGEAAVAGPVVVKSRRSHKGDVVVRLENPSAVRDFAADAPPGPYIVQDFVPNAGWDHKLWAVGPHVFAAVRRSELAAPPQAQASPPARTAVPDTWRDLVARVGEVFALDVYGVDVIPTPTGPLIVDINAFPGVRDQPGAPEALAELTLRSARRR